MASGTDVKNAAGIPNGTDYNYILESLNNPVVGVQSYLQKLGQGNLGSPFTQFLLRDLGNQGTLNTLFAAYAPQNVYGSGPQQKYDFNAALLNSFYPNTKPNSSLAPGVPNPSSSEDFSGVIPNLADYQGIGTKIRSLLSGTDQSQLGSQFAATGLNALQPDDVVQKISALIDATSAFTMDNTQKTMIENQLGDLETKYWASGAYATQPDFGQYILDKAADWLNIWWQSGDTKQADKAVSGTGVTSDEQSQAEKNKAQYYATQQASPNPPFSQYPNQLSPY